MKTKNENAKKINGSEIGTILFQDKDAIRKKEDVTNQALLILNNFKEKFENNEVKVNDNFLDFMETVGSPAFFNKIQKYKDTAIAGAEKAMAASGQLYVPLVENVKKMSVESIDKLIECARLVHLQFKNTGCSYSEFEEIEHELIWKANLQETLTANYTLRIETSEQSDFWGNYLQAKNYIKLLEESLIKNYKTGVTPYNPKETLRLSPFTDGLFLSPHVVKFINE